MIDQKVLANVCNEPAMCNCPICGAKPKQFQGDSPSHFVIKSEKCLEYGMQCLHYWMRTFEFLMKLGFKRIKNDTSLQEHGKILQNPKDIDSTFEYNNQ